MERWKQHLFGNSFLWLMVMMVVIIINPRRQEDTITDRLLSLLQPLSVSYYGRSSNHRHRPTIHLKNLLERVQLRVEQSKSH